MNTEEKQSLLDPEYRQLESNFATGIGHTSVVSSNQMSGEFNFEPSDQVKKITEA